MFTCRWDLKAALLHLPNHWSNPVLQITVNVEHKTVSGARVRRNQWRRFCSVGKALTQTSSWVSCDANPFICSPSLCTRHLPNMLIYPNMPSYSTVQSAIFRKQRASELVLILLESKSTFLHKHIHITDTNAHTHTIFVHACKFPEISKGIYSTCMHTCTETPLQGRALGAAVFVHLWVASVN